VRAGAEDCGGAKGKQELFHRVLRFVEAENL